MIAAVGHGLALSNSFAAVGHGLALSNSFGAFRFQLLRFRAMDAHQKSPKSIKIRLKKLTCFNMFLRSFFDRFGAPKGSQNRPKSCQVGPKTALETIFFAKSEFSRKPLKTNEKSTFLSPRGDPKRPKIVPRSFQDDLISLFFSFRFLH